MSERGSESVRTFVGLSRLRRCPIPGTPGASQRTDHDTRDSCE